MIEQVIELICNIKGSSIQKEQITCDSSLTDDVALDSLELIRLILDIETTYGIEFDFEHFDFDLLNTVGDFSDYIEQQVNADS